MSLQVVNRFSIDGTQNPHSYLPLEIKGSVALHSTGGIYFDEGHSVPSGISIKGFFCPRVRPRAVFRLDLTV